MSVVIRVENLAKCYRLGVINRQMLHHELQSRWARWRGRPDPNRRIDEKAGEESGDFWALDDINLEVRAGEVIGLIGGNGAGKSTLLKILSSITAPTRGRVLLKGAVASLLEVGTGFHPELTGRENVFLNGAILGMRHAEIKRKFDMILDFAEVGKFIDTPVKRYSSGMYVRLAFAVAAHLSPEILVVDEVLAVGDAAFQKKCLGKMNDVAKEDGRTVLFVSHNMAAVQSLCQKAVLLAKGKIVNHGPAREVVQYYMETLTAAVSDNIENRTDRSGDQNIRLTGLEIESASKTGAIQIDSRLKVTIHYRSADPVSSASFLVGVYDSSNNGIFLLNSEAAGGLPEKMPAEGSVTCVTEPINLTPGRCYVNIAVLKAGTQADYVQNAAYFDVEPTDIYGSGKLPPREWVLCVLPHQWSMNSQ